MTTIYVMMADHTMLNESLARKLIPITQLGLDTSYKDSM